MNLSGPALNLRPRYNVAPGQNVAPVHHRMPVVLPPELFDPWLQGQAVPLDPYPAEAMDLRAVTTRVNNASNDDPGCVMCHECWALIVAHFAKLPK